MSEYYDRYKSLRSDGKSTLFPDIKIEELSSDIYIRYNKNTMRFDNLSYKYYGDSNYAWLILMANPQYGSMEYSIEDGVSLRIPYPLQTAINRYESAIQNT